MPWNLALVIAKDLMEFETNKMKRSLLILALFSSPSGFSQNLTIEALYYNTRNEPIKVERKYESKSGKVFVKHTNTYSQYLQDYQIKKGDTTIIEETLFEIVRTTQKDKLTSLDGFAILKNDSTKTKTLSLYNFERDEYLGDTVLPINYDTENFVSDMRKTRVSDIIQNKINVPLDSLIFKEKTKTYFVNSIPAIIEFYDSKDFNHLTSFCSVLSNIMVCKSYIKQPSIDLISIDTIKWNKDTTVVTFRNDDKRWKDIYFIDYHIQNRLKILFTKDKQETTQYLYLDKRKIFTNIITGNLIYYDFPFSFNLKFYFERQKILHKRSNRRNRKFNKYKFDKNQRVIRKEITINDTLNRYVEYEYFMEK